MTFNEAMATQPAWIQVWVSILGLVLVGSVLVLVFGKETRRDALVIAAVIAATIVAMQWLYGQVGYVRLLGLVHIVLWTPLAIYLVRRLKDPTVRPVFRAVITTLLVAMVISLAFDVVDVVRYVLGEHASLVPLQN